MSQGADIRCSLIGLVQAAVSAGGHGLTDCAPLAKGKIVSGKAAGAVMPWMQTVPVLLRFVMHRWQGRALLAAEAGLSVQASRVCVS